MDYTRSSVDVLLICVLCTYTVPDRSGLVVISECFFFSWPPLRSKPRTNSRRISPRLCVYSALVVLRHILMSPPYKMISVDHHLFQRGQQCQLSMFCWRSGPIQQYPLFTQVTWSDLSEQKSCHKYHGKWAAQVCLEKLGLHRCNCYKFTKNMAFALCPIRNGYDSFMLW